MNIPEPCPFCGIAVTPKRDGGMDGYWHGYSECPLSEGWYYRLNWNRRQPTPEAAQDKIPGLVNGVRSLVKYHSKHGTMHLDCVSDFNDLVGSYPDYSPSGVVVNESSAHPPKPEPTEEHREARKVYPGLTKELLVDLLEAAHAVIDSLLESEAPKPPAEWMAPAQTMLDAWTHFKNCYEHCGAGSPEAGRAWDLVNRAAKRLEEAQHYSAPAGDKT